MAELKYKKLQSRVTQKVYTKMRRLAKKRDISTSGFIRELILEAIAIAEEAKKEDKPDG